MNGKDNQAVSLLIPKKLDELEQLEQVKILHAVESGSRAWGFASPDSDYDVRIVYVRKKEYYLRLEEKPDFINWELNDVYDINGWDLDKALRLFQKSNATLFEWANSPVVYRTTREWEEIYGKMKGFFAKKAAMYHYYGTAKSNYLQYLGGERVNYKKYFYVIRPLLACRWIDEHAAPPPVFFDTLKQQMPDHEIKARIDELQEQKIKMKEGEMGSRQAEIHRFIEAELAFYEARIKALPDERNNDWAYINQVFLKQIEG